MIVDMTGKEVTSQNHFAKEIRIKVNPLLEDDRLKDFVESYLIPFMNQLQFPCIDIDYE